MIEKIFENFKKYTILVIGDVMIDAYWTGSVNRISPESPVPVLEIKSRDYRLGGAANVALNLQSLGATPILCSIIGKDNHENLFFDLLKKNNLTSDAIFSSPQRTTTMKYRMIANHSQLLRVDEENRQEIGLEEQQQLFNKIEKLITTRSVDAIIFEDYDKGLLNKELIAKIVDLAKKNKIIVTVDPKRKNFHHYQGVTLFKPNLKELKEGFNQETDFSNLQALQEAIKEFAEKMNFDFLLTTLSEKGVTVYDRKEDKSYHHNAYLRQIADVSGAGDTVIAVSTLLLIEQLPISQIAAIANLAGGIVCEYAGVVPIKKEELKQQILKNKLI